MPETARQLWTELSRLARIGSWGQHPYPIEEYNRQVEDILRRLAEYHPAFRKP